VRSYVCIRVPGLFFRGQRLFDRNLSGRVVKRVRIGSLESPEAVPGLLVRAKRVRNLRRGIRKSVETYDLSKFSVTNVARLLNYFRINLFFNYYTYVKLLFNSFAFKFCISTSKMILANKTLFRNLKSPT
jgi:hypothetical protein